MRVLICGGRDFTDKEKLNSILGEIYFRMGHEEQNEFVLIHGAAAGADSLAGEWCRKHCYPWSENVYPADWDRHGRKAGYIRNKQMLDEGKPDLVLAFPGGKGTAMMVKLSKLAGVEVIEVP